jgi:hypothetical protein
VILEWAPSTDPTVVGYSVAYGDASGAYTNTINAGTNTFCTVSGLLPGSTYYFVASSYNASGVYSTPTVPVAYVVPETPATTGLSVTNGTVNLQFPVVPSTAYALQASSDLETWESIWTFTSGNTNGLIQFSEPFTNTVQARFYRLVSE